MVGSVDIYFEIIFLSCTKLEIMMTQHLNNRCNITSTVITKYKRTRILLVINRSSINIFYYLKWIGIILVSMVQ